MRRSRPQDLIVFLGPSLGAREAKRLFPCEVLPPARSGDLFAALSGRPLAIALVDGFFESVPSVWHHEILEALEAGVAVFGGGSLGALRAAELDRYGMVGVGRIYRWVKSGVVEDDAEVALLHGPAEFDHAPLTVPLVSVRAAVADAQVAKVLRRGEARAIFEAAQAIHFTERDWDRVLLESSLGAAAVVRFRAFLPQARDPKTDDARATVLAAAEFVRARRAGAPPPQRPRARSWPSSHVRRAKLACATSLVPGGKRVSSATVLRALALRKDAGRLAADGLRRALVSGLARSAGVLPSKSEATSALLAWLSRMGVRSAARDAFLAACGLDEADARRLGEDLATEAMVLSAAHAYMPDGPDFEEGLALAARLSGAWVEEALRAGNVHRSRVRRTVPRSSPRRRARNRSL